MIAVRAAFMRSRIFVGSDGTIASAKAEVSGQAFMAVLRYSLRSLPRDLARGRRKPPTNWRMRGLPEVWKICSAAPCVDDTAVLGEDDDVADLLGEAHLVGHEDAGHALADQFTDHRQHFADGLGIERRGHLVEQDQFRLHRQRAGDRDALLLTAGKLARIGIGFFRSRTLASSSRAPRSPLRRARDAEDAGRRDARCSPAPSGAGTGCTAGTRCRCACAARCAALSLRKVIDRGAAHRDAARAAAATAR